MEIKRSQLTRRLVMRAPFNYSQVLGEILPSDAEIQYVELQGIRLSVGEHNEAHLKEGYRTRVMPGSQIATTFLAEDFLQKESTQFAKDFRVTCSIVLNTQGYVLSTSGMIDDTDDDSIQVHSIELELAYTASHPVFQGIELPEELPKYELKDSVYAIEITGISAVPDEPRHLSISAVGIDKPFKLEKEFVEIQDLDVGKVLVLTARGGFIVLTKQQFDENFTRVLHGLEPIKHLEQQVAQMH